MINTCIKNNIQTQVLPGPTAFIPALVNSGFDTTHFNFYGFLKNRNEKKKTEINTKNTIKLDENTKKVIDNLGFKVGDKVRHKKFGLGVIKSIDAKKIYVQYVDGVKEMAIILADKLLTKSE